MKRTGLWPFFFGLFGALPSPFFENWGSLAFWKVRLAWTLESASSPLLAGGLKSHLGAGELLLLAGGLKAHLGAGELHAPRKLGASSAQAGSNAPLPQFGAAEFLKF